MLPRPLHHAEYEKVFRKDRANLIDEVEGLVHSTSARKVDDLVRRGRLALVHVRLCELAPRPEKEKQRRNKEIPRFCSAFPPRTPRLAGQHIRKNYAPGLLKRLLVPGTAKRAKRRAIADLEVIFATVLRNFGDELSEGDFPSLDEFVAGLRVVDLHALPYASAEIVDDLKFWLTEEIPRWVTPDADKYHLLDRVPMLSPTATASIKRRKKKRSRGKEGGLSAKTRRLLIKVLLAVAVAFAIAVCLTFGAVAYAVLVDNMDPQAALKSARDALTFRVVAAVLKLGDLLNRAEHFATAAAAECYERTVGLTRDPGNATVDANATAAASYWWRRSAL